MKAAVPHFRPDIVLVKVKDIRGGQIRIGAVQGTDYLPTIFSDGLYVGVSLEVWVEFVPVGLPGGTRVLNVFFC